VILALPEIDLRHGLNAGGAGGVYQHGDLNSVSDGKRETL